MSAPTDDAVRLDSVTEVTWTQLISASGLPEGELRELVRYGALVPRDPDAPTWTFESRWLVVARTVSRLRHDFELDALWRQRRAELRRAHQGTRRRSPQIARAVGLTAKLSCAWATSCPGSRRDATNWG